MAIPLVFKIAQIDPSEIDAIAIGGLLRTHAPIKEEPLFVKLYQKYAGLFKNHTITQLLTNNLHRHRKMDELKAIFKEMSLNDKKIMFVEHHKAHAACAFYQRPWDQETLVLTLDGAGDGLCSTVGTGVGFNIERIASTTSFNSPGNVLYSEITGFLGLKRWEHEYKVMGMAPYGLSEPCMKMVQKIIRINPRNGLEFENLTGKYIYQIQPKLREMFAEQRFDNISACHSTALREFGNGMGSKCDKKDRNIQYRVFWRNVSECKSQQNAP